MTGVMEHRLPVTVEHGHCSVSRSNWWLGGVIRVLIEEQSEQPRKQSDRRGFIEARVGTTDPDGLSQHGEVRVGSGQDRDLRRRDDATQLWEETKTAPLWLP